MIDDNITETRIRIIIFVLMLILIISICPNNTAEDISGTWKSRSYGEGCVSRTDPYTMHYEITLSLIQNTNIARGTINMTLSKVDKNYASWPDYYDPIGTSNNYDVIGSVNGNDYIMTISFEHGISAIISLSFNDDSLSGGGSYKGTANETHHLTLDLIKSNVISNNADINIIIISIIVISILIVVILYIVRQKRKQRLLVQQNIRYSDMTQYQNISQSALNVDTQQRKYCPYCNGPLTENSQFCPYCGK